MIDNTSAASQINNMGTCHIEECNSLVVQIWEFSISHNIPGLQQPILLVTPMLLQMANLGIFHSQDTEWMLTLNCCPGPLDA